MEVEAVLEELKTSVDGGLSEDEAKKRLEKYGKDKLPEKKKRSALIRFLLHFHNVLIYVLIAAGVLALFQIIFTYVPFMNTLFGTSPIHGHHWIYVLSAGIIILIVVEAEKLAARTIGSMDKNAKQ